MADQWVELEAYNEIGDPPSTVRLNLNAVTRVWSDSQQVCQVDGRQLHLTERSFRKLWRLVKESDAVAVSDVEP